MHQSHYKKIYSCLIIAIIASTSLSCGVVAHAQSSGDTNAVNDQYTLLTPLPELNGTSNAINSISLSQFISYAYKFMLALAVVLAVFMITVGGFEYMLSGAANTKSDALKKIQNAVWGLLLALVTYLLLYTIDPNLVSPNNLTIPPITYSAALTATNGATTALQTQLNQSASQLNQSQLQNQTVTAGVTAENQAAAAQAQADSLSDQLDANNCDPSNTTPPCSTLEQQYETAQDQADMYTSQATTQSAINAMSNAATTFEETNGNLHVAGLTGGTTYNIGNTDVNAAQSALTSINATYDQSYSQIENGDVADRQLLTNQKTYQDASIIQDYQTNQTISNLLNDQGAEEAGYSEDVAAAQVEIKSLQANQIPVQLDGTPVTGIGNLNNNPTLSAQYAADNQARIQKIQAVCGSACATSK